MTIEIHRYMTSGGVDPFQKWLDTLRDQSAKGRIAARLARFAAGVPGDCRSVGGGVWEMRIDSGPGYRLYYGQNGKTAILLMIGGDKSSQQSDIQLAMAYWADFQRRQ